MDTFVAVHPLFSRACYKEVGVERPEPIYKIDICGFCLPITMSSCFLWKCNFIFFSVRGQTIHSLVDADSDLPIR